MVPKGRATLALWAPSILNMVPGWVSFCKHGRFVYAKRSLLIITVVLSNNSIDLTFLTQDVIKYQKQAFRLHETHIFEAQLGLPNGLLPPRRPKMRPQMSKIAPKMPKIGFQTSKMALQKAKINSPDVQDSTQDGQDGLPDVQDSPPDAQDRLPIAKS